MKWPNHVAELETRSPNMGGLFGRTIILILLVGILGAMSSTGQTAKSSEEELSKGLNSQTIRTQTKVTIMVTQTTFERVKNKDWSLTNEPAVLDVDEVLALLPLCDNADTDIRELTIYVIQAVNTSKARHCIIKALRDMDINVRSAASRFLMDNHHPEDIELLHLELQENSDDIVRESVMRVLGLIANPSSRDVIAQHMENEEYDHVKHAAHLALVRLKDPYHRQQYVDRLGNADPRNRVQALIEFGYIQDLDFLPQIMPLLSDEAKGKNIGPSKSKIWLRVCDVAVNVLDLVLRHPFAFEIDPQKNYLQQERIEAANIIRNLGRGH